MPIKVNNLFYTYNKKTQNEALALDGISLTIKDHSFVAFVGHTGSGKSTLIQHLNALIVPQQGTIEVDEFVIGPKAKKNKHIKQLRKHLGIVFQFPEYQLFEQTVEKDVAFGPRNFGLKEEEALEKAHEALKQVGLDESYYKRSPFDLSGGEKRRVAIAGILAINPDILVLDEPTAGLDHQGEKDIMSLITKMHEDGHTIILVTHDMNIVMRYVEEVFVMSHGKLVYQGAPCDLFNEYQEDWAIEIPALYAFAKSLKDKGAPIDITKIKEVDDLIYQIKEWKAK